MRKHRVLLIALGAALFTPALAEAQEPERHIVRFFGRGMLGIMTEAVPAGSPDARERIVVDVVPGSPAEKAGVAKGDTVLRINGLAATSQVMSAPFEPGDTVVLRVKRNGRDFDVKVVAAERSGQVQALIGDSVFGRMNFLMENMRVNIDSLMPRFTMHRVDGDSVFTVIIGRDTIVARGARVFEGTFPPDSGHRIFGAMPVEPFSSVFGDSTHISIFRNIDGNVFAFGDSVDVVRPFEFMRAGTLLGVRAVAGAELTDLNGDLGEYFGTTSGVLVTNARTGTPAERAGLRAGDVITRVNDTAVTNVMELRRAIERGGSEPVRLRVLRRGQNVDVTLGR